MGVEVCCRFNEKGRKKMQTDKLLLCGWLMNIKRNEDDKIAKNAKCYEFNYNLIFTPFYYI